MYRKSFGYHTTPEFDEWFNKQPDLDQWHIGERLSLIATEGHFGDRKYLDHDVYELRWKNGRRVYYGYLKALNIVIILGGNKNGQKRDIARAKRIFKNYEAYGKKGS